MSNRKQPAALFNFDKLPNSAHVRIDVVKMITGYSAPSIWRRAAKTGDPFPKPRKMGPKNTAWNVGELRKFVAGCSAWTMKPHPNSRLRERILRRLALDGMTLHRCPEGSRLFVELGTRYLMRRGAVVRTHVDLEALARELGVPIVKWSAHRTLDARALWRAIEAGSFPAPVRGPKGLEWSLDAVLRWKQTHQ